MVVNVRGTNGSGKSTLMRQLMEMHGRVPIVSKEGKEIAYYVEGAQGHVIGKYTTACGGCDTIKTQAESKELVSRYAGMGNVFFEGVLISTIFGPWLEFSRAHGGMLWAFLDTPLQTCLDRVQQRNGGKPVKEDQIAGKWHLMRRIADKAKEAGEQVVWLGHQDPLTHLMDWMTPYRKRIE